ncbi:MAG TPA: phage holin family protein [Candidatus Acidoferrales bacterium]|nr:phage holin family protein [Candidatus Acidoferrales bacterium]
MDQPPNSSIAALVSGIVNDLRELVTVELKIAWAEVEQELRRARITAIRLVVASGLIVIGGLFLMQMLVQLLYSTLNWPLWICYGAAGLVAVVAGAGMAARGRR